MTVKCTNILVRIGLVVSLLVAAILPLVVLVPETVFAAGGSKQIIIGGYNNALSKIAAEYNVLQGGYTWNVTIGSRLDES